MSIPDWAHFMGDAARYGAFVTAVEAVCAGLDLALELGEGSLRPRIAEPGSLLSVGLKPLAQRWHALGAAAPGPAGEALLCAELEAVAARLVPDPTLEAELDVLERARARLRLRLFNERAAVALAVGLVSRRLTRGLFAVLALDLPTSLRPVSPTRLAGWGSSLDALWDEALAQTLAVEVEVEVLQLFGRIPCVAVTGDSLVTTSQLLGLGPVLESALGQLPPHGAVAVVPNRHTLLAYPLGIHALAVGPAMLGLSRAGAQLYEQGPGSLSPELNWWRPGSEGRGAKLEHIRASIDASGRLQLGAPEAFMREVVGEV